MIGGIIAGILLIILLLALIGLGWDTVISGVKKGADSVGKGTSRHHDTSVASGDSCGSYIICLKNTKVF